MINKFKKQISFLFAGSFSMVLAACYGAPVNMENTLFVKALNQNNEPIEGLQVVLQNNGYSIDTAFSETDGTVSYPELNITSSYKVIIEDIDGELNGGTYLKKEVEITDNFNIEVTMEK
jgi:putative lipoprotein (rSAM/lipoprotein system)